MNPDSVNQQQQSAVPTVVPDQQQQQQNAAQTAAALRAITQQELKDNVVYFYLDDVDADDRLQCFGETSVMHAKRKQQLLQQALVLAQQQQQQQPQENEKNKSEGVTASTDKNQNENTNTNNNPQDAATAANSSAPAPTNDSSSSTEQQENQQKLIMQLLLQQQQQESKTLTIDAEPRAGDVESGGARPFSEQGFAAVKLRKMNPKKFAELLQQEQDKEKKMLSAARNTSDYNQQMIALQASAAAGSAVQNMTPWLPPLRPIELSSFPMLAKSNFDVSQRGLDLMERLREGAVAEDAAEEDFSSSINNNNMNSTGAAAATQALYSNGVSRKQVQGSICARNAFAGLRLVQRFHREAAQVPPPAAMAALMDLALGIGKNSTADDTSTNNDVDFLMIRMLNDDENENDDENDDMDQNDGNMNQQKTQRDSAVPNEGQNQNKNNNNNEGDDDEFANPNNNNRFRDDDEDDAANKTTSSNKNTNSNNNNKTSSTTGNNLINNEPEQILTKQQQTAIINEEILMYLLSKDSSGISRMATASLEIASSTVGYGTWFRGAALRRSVKRLLTLADRASAVKDFIYTRVASEASSKKSSSSSFFDSSSTANSSSEQEKKSSTNNLLLTHQVARTKALQAQHVKSVKRFIDQLVYLVEQDREFPNNNNPQQNNRLQQVLQQDSASSPLQQDSLSTAAGSPRLSTTSTSATGQNLLTSVSRRRDRHLIEDEDEEDDENYFHFFFNHVRASGGGNAPTNTKNSAFASDVAQSLLQLFLGSNPSSENLFYRKLTNEALVSLAASTNIGNLLRASSSSSSSTSSSGGTNTSSITHNPVSSILSELNEVEECYLVAAILLCHHHAATSTFYGQYFYSSDVADEVDATVGKHAINSFGERVSLPTPEEQELILQRMREDEEAKNKRRFLQPSFVVNNNTSGNNNNNESKNNKSEDDPLLSTTQAERDHLMKQPATSLTPEQLKQQQNLRTLQSRNDADRIASAKIAFELLERILLQRGPFSFLFQQQQKILHQQKARSVGTVASNISPPISILPDVESEFGFWNLISNSSIFFRLLEMCFGGFFRDLLVSTSTSSSSGGFTSNQQQLNSDGDDDDEGGFASPDAAKELLKESKMMMNDEEVKKKKQKQKQLEEEMEKSKHYLEDKNVVESLAKLAQKFGTTDGVDRVLRVLTTALNATCLKGVRLWTIDEVTSSSSRKKQEQQCRRRQRGTDDKKSTKSSFTVFLNDDDSPSDNDEDSALGSSFPKKNNQHHHRQASIFALPPSHATSWLKASIELFKIIRTHYEQSSNGKGEHQRGFAIRQSFYEARSSIAFLCSVAIQSLQQPKEDHNQQKRQNSSSSSLRSECAELLKQVIMIPSSSSSSTANQQQQQQQQQQLDTTFLLYCANFTNNNALNREEAQHHHRLVPKIINALILSNEVDVASSVVVHACDHHIEALKKCYVGVTDDSSGVSLSSVLDSMFSVGHNDHQQKLKQKGLRTSTYSLNELTTMFSSFILSSTSTIPSSKSTAAVIEKWISLIAAWSNFSSLLLASSASTTATKNNLTAILKILHAFDESRISYLSKLPAATTTTSSSSSSSSSSSPQQILDIILSNNQQDQFTLVKNIITTKFYNQVWWTLMKFVDAVLMIGNNSSIYSTELFSKFLFTSSSVIYQMSELQPTIQHIVNTRNIALGHTTGRFIATNEETKNKSRLTIAEQQHIISRSPLNILTSTLCCSSSFLSPNPPSVASALKIVRFEEQIRKMLSSLLLSPSSTSLTCATLGSQSSPKLATALSFEDDDGNVSFLDSTGGATLASSNQTFTTSLESLFTPERSELFDICLIRRVLAPFISAKADLAEALRTISIVSPCCTSASTAKTIKFYRVARGSLSLLQLFQQRRLPTSLTTASIEKSNLLPSTSASSSSLPDEIKNASMIFACSESALLEIASSPPTTNQVLFNQMQKYWDATTAAMKKMPATSADHQRPVLVFLVPISTVVSILSSKNNNNKNTTETQKKSVAQLIVHLLRKYGSTWFTLLPVSGELHLNSNYNNTKSNIKNEQTLLKIAREMKHSIGVKKTTIMVGKSDEEEMKSECKNTAVDVPCLSVGDFVSRIQQAQQQAVQKK